MTMVTMIDDAGSSSLQSAEHQAARVAKVAVDDHVGVAAKPLRSRRRWPDADPAGFLKNQLRL
jgi:hypothetical protein